jgi:hypothetical protein
MEPFLAIRDALNQLAEGLHIEDEELSADFDESLSYTSAQVEDLVAREFSINLAKRAVALRLAAGMLTEDPSPDAMAQVLHEFGALVSEMDTEVRAQPQAAEWHLVRQFHEIAEYLGSPKPAENQGFLDLPRMLMESPWLMKCLADLSHAASVHVESTPLARGFSKGGSARWFKRATRKHAGQLCAALAHHRSSIEFRSRQVWFLRHSGGEDKTAPYYYVRAHAELFPEFRRPLNGNELALEVAKLKGLALGLQLPEFAICFDSTDWPSGYALNHLVPPVPTDWAVRHAPQLQRLLDGRLSRWYLNPFDHRLEPLEMTATVLRMGRPLFYERIAAHALLEYSLLQGIAVVRNTAPFYLEALNALEREFETLFDGYLLRLQHYPRLKTPEGWCSYLEALNALHFGGAANVELEAFRQVFLARRGLRSTQEILFRTTESHSSVN